MRINIRFLLRTGPTFVFHKFGIFSRHDANGCIKLLALQGCRALNQTCNGIEQHWNTMNNWRPHRVNREMG